MKKFLLSILMMTSLLYGTYFGKNKIQTGNEKWNQIKTMHFDIYFVSSDEQFAYITALMAENAYYHLKESFRTPIKNHIPIIFYNTQSSFQSTNVIPPLLSSGIQGFTESVKNRVVLPFDGSYLKLEEILVHELTHAYVNAIDGGNSPVSILRTQIRYPFWFSEGLPEFQAVHGKSLYNNMFILDKTINGNLTPMEDTYGYWAYRQGESFITFLAEKYGKENVMNLFYGFHSTSSLDELSKRYFGFEFDRLQEQWHSFLKKKYFKLINEFDIPTEKYQKITDYKKEGSSLNYAPSFSPDGSDIVYFSNKDLRLSIWKTDSYQIKSKKKKIIQGESSATIEEFNYNRNNIDWLSDGKTIVFSARNANGDVIYFADSNTGKIYKTLSFHDIDGIYELDATADGQEIVFSGQKNMQTDLFLYDLKNNSLTQITNDRYHDFQPKWSDDETAIAFASERTISEVDSNFIFYGLHSNIFVYDLEEKNFYQVTYEKNGAFYPRWYSKEEIMFIGADEDAFSLKQVNILSGKKRDVIKVLSGIYSYDLSSDKKDLVFSCFYNNGWDIFLAENFTFLNDYQSYKEKKKVIFIDDFTDRFNLSRYKKYGFRELKFKEQDARILNKKATVLTLKSYVSNDSLAKEYNKKIDSKPTDELNPPVIKPYKTKYNIESFWGGMAYSSYSGVVGQFQATFSDLLGNNYIGVKTNLSTKLDDSDFIFNYYYLPKRWDFGIGGFYTTDYLIYHYIFSNGNDEYLMKKYTLGGVFGSISYPFNRYWRAELQSSFYSFKRNYFLWNENSDEWEDDENYINSHGFMKNDKEDFIVNPVFSFVHDNIIYGSTGPIDGWRGKLSLGHHFSIKDTDFDTAILDVRYYNFFLKYYSFATRLFVGHTTSSSDYYFDFDGDDTVRGISDSDESLEGDTKVITSYEFRAPFIEHLKLKFPLPFELHYLQGSAFVDVGAVWNMEDKFTFYADNRLQDLKVGFGFGPRINIGIMILKFDVNWNYDLYNVSKPSYQIRIGEDF